MDIPLESDDSSAGRMRTAASGNPLFTIADWSGIFDMEIIFCVCTDSNDTAEQLLRSGLFPATFKQIETLFTFSVLEDFLADNLECKTTAQQYYSKLQSMTSKMFPNSVPVCCFSFMLSCRYLISGHRTVTSNS
jgi:CxC2 like cysteine cluster associated with KDZ transposases